MQVSQCSRRSLRRWSPRRGPRRRYRRSFGCRPRRGTTNCGLINRAPGPAQSDIAHKRCTPELIFAATTQPAGKPAHHGMLALRHTVASTACPLITRLAGSAQTRTMRASPPAPSRVICDMGAPVAQLQIEEHETQQSWRLDAAARMWEGPSYSAEPDTQRRATPGPHLMLALARQAAAFRLAQT